MLGSYEMKPLKTVRYKNKLYKNLSSLYHLNKNEDSPSFEWFRKKLLKTNSIGLALKKPNKKLRTEYYKKLYKDNKDENSVTEALFIRRMRRGAKLIHAINRKEMKTLKSPIIIDGYLFNSLTKLAKHFSLIPSTVIARYNRGLRGKKLIKESNLCDLID